jgi:hypothetical protein
MSDLRSPEVLVDLININFSYLRSPSRSDKHKVFLANDCPTPKKRNVLWHNIKCDIKKYQHIVDIDRVFNRYLTGVFS